MVPPEVVGVQVLELEVRAGRAVVDEDALVQRSEVRDRSALGRAKGGEAGTPLLFRLPVSS